MTAEVARLVLLNAGYAVVGAAALLAVGWVTAERASWHRLGVALPLGIVLVAIPASYLALLYVPVTWSAPLIGLAIVAVAAVRTRPWTVPRVGRPSWSPKPGTGPLAVVLFLVLALLLAHGVATFATRPVIEWDSFVIWLAKARLLYDAPFDAPAALRSGNYGQAPYPLGLPTLEALGFGAIGRYDGTVIGLQFLLLAAAFPLALWSLLRAHARPWVIALVALATVAAPQAIFQLLTRYADVPLGLFVGLGLAAGAAWVVAPRSDGWLLGCFTCFLVMAGLTKNEGLLFALAGAVALAAATLANDRRRLRPALVACGTLVAVILPWRLYCAAFGLTTPDYDLGHATSPSYLHDHVDRLRPTVNELWRQASNTDGWGLLVWVIALALVLGVVEARWGLLTFAGLWLALALGGLLLTYWISVLPTSSHLTNTSDRTFVSLLIGGAALVPLFLFPRGADA